MSLEIDCRNVPRDQRPHACLHGNGQGRSALIGKAGRDGEGASRIMPAPYLHQPWLLLQAANLSSTIMQAPRDESKPEPITVRGARAVLAVLDHVPVTRRRRRLVRLCASSFWPIKRRACGSPSSCRRGSGGGVVVFAFSCRNAMRFSDRTTAAADWRRARPCRVRIGPDAFVYTAAGYKKYPQVGCQPCAFGGE